MAVKWTIDVRRKAKVEHGFMEALTIGKIAVSGIGKFDYDGLQSTLGKGLWGTGDDFMFETFHIDFNQTRRAFP